jgi:FHA domain-containing protein
LAQDPFGGASGLASWDLPKAAPAPASASPFDLMPGAPALPGDLDLLGAVSSGGAPSLDQMFGLSGASGASDPLAAFLQNTAPAAPAEASAGAPSELDPLALLGGREQVVIEPVARPSALPDNVPELQGAMPLPAVRPAASASALSPSPAGAAQRPTPIDDAFDFDFGSPQPTPTPTPTASASASASLTSPASAHPEPLSASFTFMPAPPSAAPVTPAPPASAGASPGPASSPFADLGLGSPLATSPASASGLLGDLDLAPQTVPGVRAHPVPTPAGAASLLDLDMPLGHEPLQAPLETQLPTPQVTPPHEPVSAGPVAEALPASAFTAASALLGEPALPADLTVVDQVMAPVAAPHADAAPSLGLGQALALEANQASPPVVAQAAHLADHPADHQALWQAFCEGAGVHFTPPQGLNPDLMRVIGQLLHHTVDGSLKLVAARAATKQEMRAEVTVIQARRNNPLKFSPDTESALEQLLQPPLRGFMTGPEAVADAMDDLLGHTIGTMVGMRAALDGVLARFEPEQLEAKLVGRSMLDSLLPMNRRAKLWELYLQHFGAVRAEAQDDFHNLFGRAFLQAYEEQLDRLDAERRQSGRTPPKAA